MVYANLTLLALGPLSSGSVGVTMVTLDVTMELETP